jgi:hypothetical protein
VLVVAGGLTVGAGGALAQEDAQAQVSVNVTMSVTENREPGLAGQVTLTRMPNNMLRVQIRITGLRPNDERAAHIHSAPGAMCDTGAPVTHPLNNVRADASGVGTSDTTVSIGPERPIVGGSAYVNVHQAATPPGPGVICANVPASIITGTGAAATTGAAQPAQQRPAGAPAAAAAPQPQRPAAAPAPAAAPPAQRAAAAPAGPAPALPRTGAPPVDDRGGNAGWLAGSLVLLVGLGLGLAGARGVRRGR